MSKAGQLGAIVMRFAAAAKNVPLRSASSFATAELRDDVELLLLDWLHRQPRSLFHDDHRLQSARALHRVERHDRRKLLDEANLDHRPLRILLLGKSLATHFRDAGDAGRLGARGVEKDPVAGAHLAKKVARLIVAHA